MKTFIIIVGILAASTCEAQWKEIGFWDQTYAFGVKDTALFISGSSVGHVFLDRYTTATGLHSASSGLDFSQGNITNFVVLDSTIYVSPGGSQITFTTNNGGSWSGKAPAAGPVGTNGAYLFGEFPYGTNIVRSRNQGKTFDSVAHLSAYYFQGIGTYVFANCTSGFYRSEDSGKTWANIIVPAGLSMNPFAVLDSQFFSGGTGVFRSTDFGQTWTPLSLQNRTVNALLSYQHYLFAGTDTGIFLSFDSGIHWDNVTDSLPAQPGYHPNITHLAIVDSLLYLADDAGRDPGSDFPYGYVFVRPISEMTDTALGVVLSEPLAGDSLSVYPNPSSSFVSLYAGTTPILGAKVLNVLGESVLALSNPHTSECSLDLSKLPSGTYFLEIQTAKGVLLRKVIRQ